jgi:hypothetical protein
MRGAKGTTKRLAQSKAQRGGFCCGKSRALSSRASIKSARGDECNCGAEYDGVECRAFSPVKAWALSRNTTKRGVGERPEAPQKLKPGL